MLQTLAMSRQSSVQKLDAQVARKGAGWRLMRIASKREPLLGALVRTGPWRQTRVVESGGLVIGTASQTAVYGPGHRIELPPDTLFLYVPLASEGPAVEWVLSVSVESAEESVPSIDHNPPASSRVEIPLADRPALDADIPDWVEPWLSLPSDVGTWASCLGIRGTSLAQRLKRLVGHSPKSILSAIRATVALELHALYDGHATDLALDVGYSSHSHLSTDIRERFGAPMSSLEDRQAALDWLRLARSAVR